MRRDGVESEEVGYYGYFSVHTPHLQLHIPAWLSSVRLFFQLRPKFFSISLVPLDSGTAQKAPTHTVEVLVEISP
jgi:hypothetical protein